MFMLWYHPLKTVTVSGPLSPMLFPRSFFWNYVQEMWNWLPHWLTIERTVSSVTLNTITSVVWGQIHSALVKKSILYSFCQVASSSFPARDTRQWLIFICYFQRARWSQLELFLGTESKQRELGRVLFCLRAFWYAPMNYDKFHCCACGFSSRYIREACRWAMAFFGTQGIVCLLDKHKFQVHIVN